MVEERVVSGSSCAMDSFIMLTDATGTCRVCLVSFLDLSFKLDCNLVDMSRVLILPFLLIH